MFDHNLTILVVDDFLTMRKIVERDLKELGFSSIVKAKDGAAAWEIFTQQQIDIVISDWNMPNMTGLELLNSIRSSDKPTTPFIMVTAESEKSQIESAKESGVDGYLIKPFGSEEIEAALNTIYEKRKAEKAS